MTTSDPAGAGDQPTSQQPWSDNPPTAAWDAGAHPGYPPPQPGYQPMPSAPPVTPDAQGRLHDPASDLTLPAGVELASLARRIGSYFLAIPLAIVTLGIGYAIWGLIVWGRGTTPAMQVLGMRCYLPTEGRVPG